MTVRFEPTGLAGAYLVHIEPRVDERGLFARTFCAKEFGAHGLETAYVQTNICTNGRAGTVRGLHFQCGPDAETKLVRCVRGALYDVIVDMRVDSPTYLRWFGAELSEDNGSAIYAPKGFAHGYQALSDGATAFYLVSAFYAPQAEGGLRFDDPKLAITWPRPICDVSGKDAQWPLL